MFAAQARFSSLEQMCTHDCNICSDLLQTMSSCATPIQHACVAPSCYCHFFMYLQPPPLPGSCQNQQNHHFLMLKTARLVCRDEVDLSSRFRQDSGSVLLGFSLCHIIANIGFGFVLNHSTYCALLLRCVCFIVCHAVLRRCATGQCSR